MSRRPARKLTYWSIRVAKGYNWKHPNTAGYGGGRGNISKVIDESILTRAQRDAYEKWRAYQKIEEEAKRQQEMAVREQQIALALMNQAGLIVKRIREITQWSDHKVRDMIEHGRIHLGEEVPDGD